MSFFRTTTMRVWSIVFLSLVGLLLTGCGGGPPPVIGEPKVVEPPTPVPPGAEVSMRIDVTSANPVSYQWKPDGRGDQIIQGKTSSAITWRAPQEPGLYNVYVEVRIDDVVTEKSVAIEVATPTPTFTPTPIDTPTLMPTHTLTPTPTPTPIPTHTLTPTPTDTLTLTLTSPPSGDVTPTWTPMPVTVVNAIRTYQPPTIDGCLDDEAWSHTQPLTYAVHPLVNDSTTAVVRLLWDDQYLYAGFDVSDTQVEESSSVDVWNGDSVGVIIENGGPIQEYRYTMLGDASDKQKLIGNSAGIETANRYEADLKGETTLNNSSDHDDGYSVEMRIAWKTPRTEGDIVAADLWSVDHDNNPGKAYDYKDPEGDSDTIFHKISWDEDQSVDTAGMKIRLAAVTVAITDPPSGGQARCSVPTPQLCLFTVQGRSSEVTEEFVIRVFVQPVFPPGDVPGFWFVDGRRVRPSADGNWEVPLQIGNLELPAHTGDTLKVVAWVVTLEESHKLDQMNGQSIDLENEVSYVARSSEIDLVVERP